MGFKAYYSWRIFAKNNYVQVVGTKTHYFESKIQPYGLIFCPRVERNEYDTIFFWEIRFVVQKQETKVYFCQQKLLTEEIT